MSSLFAPLFSTPAMEAIFGDLGHVQGMLDFEAALARAEATCGVIPQPAVAAIGAACDAGNFDLSALGKAAALAGNTAIPLIKALTAHVARTDPEAARWVHWGATSQDSMDSGLVLQIRTALAALLDDMDALAGDLAVLADRHRDTVMIGRTWLQHALPVTFGLKVAGWLSALQRARQRLRQAAEAIAVIQLGGAAGTLASLGDDGGRVAQALADDLGLTLPDIPWHGQRDRVTDLGAALGLLAGTLGKIARDLSLMMQSEVGEVAEPVMAGRGGSSAMPHKRNPVGCAVALAVAQRTPGLLASLFGGLVGEHERSLGSWQSEWQTLPELFRLTGASLAAMATVMAGLQIFPDKMARNVALTGGLVMAESVTMVLGRRIGRLAAHHMVEQASHRALAENQTLALILQNTPAITDHLSASEIDTALNPRAYLGQTNEFIDHVLSMWHQSCGGAP